ncbi:hypothetical protein Cgig2_010179 [Carnegiea gigantea]|uniref:Exonuclease 1 n=1 Tax=Carnegiea gigantea TaxID=171969 RepID=A0A9Q1KGX3_9CARY|nr:hypothetical protein Cgig2_010179 [Carnegiea gigantea]
MGIKDLLRFMKPYTEPIHIQKYAGKRVGIDAYSWLHKGAYSCSMEISLNSEGDKKFQYINYFMHRVNLLKYHKITPVVVLDGGNIPCKAATENERCRQVSEVSYAFRIFLFMCPVDNLMRIMWVFDGEYCKCLFRRRKANKEMAMQKLKEGNVNAATELFQRAISITPSMAHELIKILRSENVEFLVAPYEADAQLAYLSSLGEEEGGIVAVISEDSDLLAYGCPAIIFKMDRFGNGEEIVLDKVFNSTIPKPSFRHFNKSLFIGMCVLAGCDFLPSVPGIGIAKAHSLVSKYRNIDRVLSVLKLDKRKQMPEDYSTSFREALAVFEHATIYDRNKKRVEHMKPLPPKLLEALGGDLDFLGPDIPPTIATAIAEGNLDPISMEAYDCSPSQNCLLGSQTSHNQDGSASRNAAGSRFSTYSSQRTTVGRLANSGPRFIVKRDEENQTESCFTVYSTRKKTEEREFSVHAIKDVNIPYKFITQYSCELFDADTAMTQRQVLKERNCSEEAAALAKLAIPFNRNEESCTVLDEPPLKTPDNNPFRKRKLSENTETTPAPESVMQRQVLKERNFSDEAAALAKLAIPFVIKTNEESCTVLDEPSLKTPDNNPFRKSKLSENTETTPTPESVVTEVESSEISCPIMDSQGSVKSKLKLINDHRHMDNETVNDQRQNGKVMKKSRRNSCKSSDSRKNSSILNFFSWI